MKTRKTNHTPKPWIISDVIGDYRSKGKVFLLGVAESSVIDHPVLIATIERHRIGSADRIPVDEKVWTANNLLLQAAPESLEVAQAALAWWHSIPSHFQAAEPKWVQAARDFIAKATGED